MGRKAAELGPLAVSRLSKPGLHFVGGVSGLALQVLPTGGRTWVMRAVVGGRRRDMGLGGYPDVTVAGAREAARQARAKIREGIDPIEEARAKRSELKAARAAALNFSECAAKYIRAHTPSWRNEKHAAQWTSTLETYAYPVMGSLLVRDIAVAHVLAVLEPIWTTKPETASRVRGRMEAVLDWAAARTYRDKDNPARWKGHWTSCCRVGPRSPRSNTTRRCRCPMLASSCSVCGNRRAWVLVHLSSQFSLPHARVR